MEFELSSMASAIGVSVPVLRFLLCFIATIPVSYFRQLIPGGPPVKHLYAATSGIILSYLSFGFTSNIHFLVPMFIGYASMLLFRRQCGLITFVFALGYLIAWYVTICVCVFKLLYLDRRNLNILIHVQPRILDH